MAPVDLDRAREVRPEISHGGKLAGHFMVE